MSLFALFSLVLVIAALASFVNYRYIGLPTLDWQTGRDRGKKSESDEILRASNVGAPITICGYNSAPSRAYFEVARRLAGESVTVSIPGHRKGLLAKLFGKRAA